MTRDSNIIIIIHLLSLPVGLYGCETRSLTLSEEHRLRVFDNRMLRKIFGPKRDWRRLHIEELYYPYSSPNITCVVKYRRMRWAGHVAHGEKCIPGFRR